MEDTMTPISTEMRIEQIDLIARVTERKQLINLIWVIGVSSVVIALAIVCIYENKLAKLQAELDKERQK